MPRKQVGAGSAAVLALASGCFAQLGNGHEWVTPRPAGQASARDVVIYGIEPRAPTTAASHCEHLGTARAWSLGEKTFPYSEFRGAAVEVGGDGITDVRPDPASQDWSRSVHLGEVVRCAPGP